MEKTKNISSFNKNFVLKSDFFTDFLRSALRLIDEILVFLSLRETEQFWGIVYDAVTKQPLDPVIVKLLYTDGREVETSVTDLGGRYGFLAKPGKFKIFVKKTNYCFPSQYAAGSSDGIYKNLYHGEFFVLNKDSEVVGPNIPMDPVNFDWNQQAKLGVIDNRPYLKAFFKKVVSIFFWFGFIFCLLTVIRLFPAVPDYLYYVLIAYFILVVLAGVLPEPRLWGKVELKILNVKPERLRLELYSALFAGVSFGRASVHENGRFLLRAAAGKYTLSLSLIDDAGQKVFLSSMPIKIGRSGVFSSTLTISQ